MFHKTKTKLNNYKIAIIGLYLGRVAPGFLPQTTAFLNRNSGKKIKARNLFDNIARKTNKNTLFYKEHAKKKHKHAVIGPYLRRVTPGFVPQTMVFFDKNHQRHVFLRETLWNKTSKTKKYKEKQPSAIEQDPRLDIIQQRTRSCKELFLIQPSAVEQSSRLNDIQQRIRCRNHPQ